MLSLHIPLSNSFLFLYISNDFTAKVLLDEVMGNADSITAAYEGWQEDSGDVDKLREYITKNKQHIEEKNFKVCIKHRLS